ncbi:MAG: hypothetical protein WBB67_01715 [bacterium]
MSRPDPLGTLGMPWKPILNTSRKMAKKKWLQAQKQEWSCKNCGAEIKWYQKICVCGQQLNAWDLPDGH